ncbi:hypothetical protein JG688_00002414 [Phytophthora aleatoria]|uniref:Uncharacterized protein n=1 Tax=Phytophthora aleatoria TaxID=2496075 RepID=A0A8J5JB04_9STRA|nr:hypothetical protein JG688_00002414 [Phytophthora aleatoria]
MKTLKHSSFSKSFARLRPNFMRIYELFRPHATPELLYGRDHAFEKKMGLLLVYIASSGSMKDTGLALTVNRVSVEDFVQTSCSLFEGCLRFDCNLGAAPGVCSDSADATGATGATVPWGGNCCTCPVVAWLARCPPSVAGDRRSSITHRQQYS